MFSKLDALPARPGVYLFRDAQGDVLYVGKAKSLRSRVRSYFQAANSDERLMLPALVSRITDLETFVTQSEKEAAILENSLIKEKQPRFNVKLRDDKEYLTLRLDPAVHWSRLELVRVPKADGAQYFGPYHSATSARRTLHLVEKHFRLRTCSDRELSNRKRPCLQYQIKRCPAPCVGLADAQEYQRQVSAVELFLSDRHDELTSELERRMRQAAEEQAYELAAVYRDQLAAVQSVRQKQRVVSVESVDRDVLGLYREGDLAELAVLSVRDGRVVDAASFSNPRVEVGDDEIVAAFLREQYGGQGAGALAPDEVLLPVLPEGAAGIAEWLSERRQAFADGRRVVRRVRLLAPERGEKRKLLELALDNARHAFTEKRRAQQDLESRLRSIQERLRLPTLPRRIECTDISHLGGLDTVGSVVALSDGRLDKKRYRTYKVKAATEGDDYAAMYEVLSRRFRRGKAASAALREGPALEGAPSAGAASEPASLPRAAGQGDLDAGAEAGAQWELPDLFVVDGGRGQLAVAQAVASDLGLFELRLAGLAKERETVSGEKLVDRIYLPGQKNPIALRANSPELFLLAMLRDEAHRFANRGRKQQGHARRFASALDEIRGIGAKTRTALLRHFGGLENLRSAGDEEILAITGVNRRHLAALREHWAAEQQGLQDAAGEPGAGEPGAGEPEA